MDSTTAGDRRGLTQRLLGATLRAWQAGDRGAWVALADAALRADRGVIYDRMVSIGVTDLRLVDHVELPDPASSGDADGLTWRVRATFSYRIAGFDTRPRTFARDLVLRSAPRGVVVPTLAQDDPAERPQPWDLDGMAARRRGAVLVLGVGDQEQLDAVAVAAERSRARVRDVWGSSAPLVCVVPGDMRSAADLLGSDPEALVGVAAVTDGPLDAGESAGADRVVILPEPWRALSSVGRDVVLTHEAVHTTVRSATSSALPLWLSEGFAEYVAYREVELPEATIVAPALRRIRAVGPPTDLPTAADFDAASGAPDVAYGLSLMAVRFLVERHGEPAVVRLVRTLGTPASAPTPTGLDGLGHPRDDRVEPVLRSELGTTRAQLVAGLRTRATALAADG